MSTDLGTFKCPNTDDGPYATEDKQIHFTEFYGGTERGKCLQISIGLNYVQLTPKELSHLIAELGIIDSRRFSYEPCTPDCHASASNRQNARAVRAERRVLSQAPAYIVPGEDE